MKELTYVIKPIRINKQKTSFETKVDSASLNVFLLQ